MFNQLCAGNQNQHSEINSLAGKFLLIISQHPVLFIHTNAHSKGKWKNRQMSWEKGVIPMPTSLLISIEQFYTEAGHCNDCPIKPNCCIKCTSSHLKRLWVGGYWPRASHRGNKTPNDTSVKCLHGVGLSSLCSFVHWKICHFVKLAAAAWPVGRRKYSACPVLISSASADYFANQSDAIHNQFKIAHHFRWLAGWLFGRKPNYGPYQSKA